MEVLLKYRKQNYDSIMQELLFTRANGQIVAYYDYGLSDDVVFWHHGVGSAGPISTIVSENAGINGFRVIEIVRSGYGNSTSNPDRGVADIAPINLELADFLGIEKFGVVAASGGGPHALAVAYHSENRCFGILIVAGIGPFTEPDFDYLIGMSEARKKHWKVAQESASEFEKSLSTIVTEISTLGIADVKAMYGKDPNNPLSEERLSQIHACMHYSIMQGTSGYMEDRLSFLKPWGFSIAEIAIPTQFWAGTFDSEVPLEHSLWMTRKIRNSELQVLEGKDHFTIMESGFVGGFRWLREVFES